MVLAPALLVAVANSCVIYAGRATSRTSVADGSKTIAIVPGCSATKGHPLLTLAGRLRAALRLYEEGRVSAILVSGTDSADDPEVEAMQTWLSARGVPSSDVLVDRGGSRTRETMTRAADLFQVKRAIVCTQTLSMPRSLFLARQAGIEAEGEAVPTRMSRSLRWLSTEAMKNTLAFVESYWSTRHDASAATAIVAVR